MPAAGSKAVEAARLSWTLGIVAVCLTMIGPCFYYLPMVIALPIAIIAVIQARTALAAADLPEASRIYGQTGLITSALALGWSLFVLVITVTVMVVYFGLILAYVGLILAMVGSGQFSP